MTVPDLSIASTVPSTGCWAEDRRRPNQYRKHNPRTELRDGERRHDRHQSLTLHPELRRPLIPGLGVAAPQVPATTEGILSKVSTRYVASEEAVSGATGAYQQVSIP